MLNTQQTKFIFGAHHNREVNVVLPNIPVVEEPGVIYFLEMTRCLLDISE